MGLSVAGWVEFLDIMRDHTPTWGHMDVFQCGDNVLGTRGSDSIIQHHSETAAHVMSAFVLMIRGKASL